MNEQKKSRVGRPTAEQALRRALEPFRSTGFDPSLVDPQKIIALLAVDPAVASETRLAAAVALIEHPAVPRSEPAQPSQPAPSADCEPDDDISRRARQILRTGTSR